MTIISSFLFTALTLITCEQQPQLASLPSVDAEAILGEPAHLGDSSSANGTRMWHLQLAYIANDTDAASGKLGAIYYLYQAYADIDDAKKKYSSIKQANSGHEGVETLHGVGDEAYFHSDGKNFLFIMARKGKGVLTMKVNKITSHTSRDAFNEVARRIVKEM